VALALSATLFSSCAKEDYNFDDLDDEILFNTAVSAPIAKVNATLGDFIDLDSMKGKFKVKPEQADAIRAAWDGRTPVFLKDHGTIIDLSIMTKEDFQRMKTLNVAIDSQNLPASTDFIEIDQLDDIFGEGNAIQEIQEFTLFLDIANETPFDFSLGLQFASGNKDFYLPIDGCKPMEGDLIINANSGSKAQPTRYTLTFDNAIAQKLKYAGGLAVKYGLNTDNDGYFDIAADSNFIMHIKTFVKATANISKID
jgi:hypothetical protein